MIGKIDATQQWCGERGDTLGRETEGVGWTDSGGGDMKNYKVG